MPQVFSYYGAIKFSSHATLDTSVSIYDLIRAGSNSISGWYMPRYVLKDVPTALSGDFANPNVSAYFNNTFILGDKYWAGPERKIIESNGYNLTVKVLSGVAEFNALLAAKYAKQEPMVFFAWRPNVIFSNYDLVRVSLPNNSTFDPDTLCNGV